MFAQTVSIQEGLWIDAETLQRAGLGKQFQIIIQAGAILLTGHKQPLFSDEQESDTLTGQLDANPFFNLTPNELNATSTTPEEINHTEDARKPLRLEDIDHPLEGTITNFDDPFSPVAVEDWNVLQ